ncbi:MAG: hypothetical protein WC544_03100 [Patescibacteria group bacterium]
MAKTIGDDPSLRQEILAAGQAALDVQNGEKSFCEHPVLGGCVGHWDTRGSSIPPFDIHNCKGCGTTKSVFPFDEKKQWPQFGQAE